MIKWEPILTCIQVGQVAKVVVIMAFNNTLMQTITVKFVVPSAINVQDQLPNAPNATLHNLELCPVTPVFVTSAISTTPLT